MVLCDVQKVCFRNSTRVQQALAKQIGDTISMVWNLWV